jgi:hypothetical protein
LPVALVGNLAKRLELLQTSGQVDGDIAEFIAASLARIGDRLGLQVDDDSFGRLATHLAMALQRARDGEQVESWEVDHSDELAQFPDQVALAQSLIAEAQDRLGAQLAPPERDFVALHLAALRSAGG